MQSNPVHAEISTRNLTFALCCCNRKAVWADFISSSSSSSFSSSSSSTKEQMRCRLSHLLFWHFYLFASQFQLQFLVFVFLWSFFFHFFHIMLICRMGWYSVTLLINIAMSVCLWFFIVWVCFFWPILPLSAWHWSLFSSMLVEILDSHHIHFSMWPLHKHASGNTLESEKENRNDKLSRLTSALARSPILTGWMAKKAFPWWRAIGPTSGSHHHH